MVELMKLLKRNEETKRAALYEVAPGLYISGSLTDAAEFLEHDVSAVINLKEETDACLPNKVHWGLYVHWPIEDGPMPDGPTVRTLARFIIGLIADGRKVLVHCHGGNNRSGLVVARTLIERGVSPEEAIDRIRRARGPHALSNRNFVEWLLMEGGEDAAAEEVASAGPRKA